MSERSAEITALIGDVGRYATHDGPGIRSTVFFKGCPLRCPWCHNPEFLSSRPEIAFYAERCLACGECLKICPEKAISMERPDRIDRQLCTGCGLCVEICPTRAIELVGRQYTVDKLMELLLRDRLFYETSGGGVTLSGGEATAQLEFCGQLLQKLKKEYIHTAIETNGFFDWPAFQEACLDWLDLILFDVKIADGQRHREVTGKTNSAIIANLSELTRLRPNDVIARVPVIPGYTDNKANISAIADLFRGIGIRRYSLLAYHPYGLSKADNVGRKVDESLSKKLMAKQELEQWHQLFYGMERVEF